MNHLKQQLSPGSVLQPNAILSIHLGNGIHQASPWSVLRLPETSLLLEGLLGKWCRESTVDLSPLPCWCLLTSSLVARQIREFLPHWRCQTLTVMFICIVLLVNWFKCYGNDIYLFFDPVNSKRAELLYPRLRVWRAWKQRYKYKQPGKKTDAQSWGDAQGCAAARYFYGNQARF